MRFLLILILVLQLNSSKADEIYNLLKIPNLEIFKLNSVNGIKYLNSRNDFRIGFKKNIRCYKSNKNNLKKKFPLIKENLEKYDSEFLKKINLRFVILCENLSISGINTAGIPDQKKGVLILDLNINEKYFERAIHHEIFHIIDDSFKYLFDKKTWSEYNLKNFKYAECSTCSDRKSLDLYNNTNGFLTEYSKSTASEDMAEVYSFLITDKLNIQNKITKDSILFNKVEFIKTTIDKINNF